MNNNQLDPFQNAPAAATPSAATFVESQRGVAEVQAAMMLAKQYPRNIDRAIAEIVQECKRPALAEVALYEYSRGGTKIEGPSIRLAEALASAMGNIHSGWQELSREMIKGEPYAEVEGWAWDIEKNRRESVKFKLRLKRDTKNGSKDLRDDRDVYEVVANNAKRRERACILNVIPGYIIDIATDTCSETLKASIKPDTVPKMVVAFQDKFGVTKEQIETFIQRDIAAIEPGQVVRLRNIFNSMKDGMSKPGEWFVSTKPPVDPNAPTTGNAGLKASLSPGKGASATVPGGGAGVVATDPSTQPIANDLFSAPEPAKNGEINIVNAETGEITTVKATDKFDINKYDLNQKPAAQMAMTMLVLALEKIPVADRSGAFVEWLGMEVVDACRVHELEVDKAMASIGINLPKD